MNKTIDNAAAAAMAFGGGVFLPGKKLNLTASMASFGSASAIAVQGGYLVNDHLAFTAGFSTNTSSGGRTGARVGVTIGW